MTCYNFRTSDLKKIRIIFWYVMISVFCGSSIYGWEIYKATNDANIAWLAFGRTLFVFGLVTFLLYVGGRWLWCFLTRPQKIDFGTPSS